MFRQVYEVSLAVFLLQGVLIPVLLLLAGTLWFRQMARLSGLERELAGERKQHRKTLASLLELVPKLQPLNCANCGSAVALEVDSATCTSCDSAAELPRDYVATVMLRRTMRQVTGAATRHWMLARVLTSAPVRWFFFLMIFGEPLIFMIVVIGSETYRDTSFDRALEGMGEAWALTVMLLGFAGFILWMIIFIFLTNLSKELRRELPGFPDYRPRVIRHVEYSTCGSCGGGIRFGARRFACLCNYCGVENFRAEHARRERAVSEESQIMTKGTLFGAMEIVEDFTATFFVTMAILSFAFLILIVVSALNAE